MNILEKNLYKELFCSINIPENIEPLYKDILNIDKIDNANTDNSKKDDAKMDNVNIDNAKMDNVNIDNDKINNVKINNVKMDDVKINDAKMDDVNNNQSIDVEKYLEEIREKNKNINQNENFIISFIKKIWNFF